MRVYDLKDNDGRVFAFELDNLWLGRRGVARVVRTIPDVSLIRVPEPVFSWWAEEEFCEFELGGVRFVAWEPFGDNSRYWIGPRPPVFSEMTAAVRDAFVAQVLRKWF